MADRAFEKPARLAVEQKTAEQEACGMEHVLGEQSFEMLRRALEAV